MGKARDESRGGGGKGGVHNSPSPSLSCTRGGQPVVVRGRRSTSSQGPRGGTVGHLRAGKRASEPARVGVWGMPLTKRENASLNSETCSSVRESAWQRRSVNVGVTGGSPTRAAAAAAVAGVAAAIAPATTAAPAPAATHDRAKHQAPLGNGLAAGSVSWANIEGARAGERTVRLAGRRDGANTPF